MNTEPQTPAHASGPPLRIGLEIRQPDKQESGQQRYLWRMGAWLAEGGHAVHYLTLLDANNPDAEIPPGTELHRLGTLPTRELAAYVAALELDVLLLNPERARGFQGIPANVLRPGYGTDQYRQNLRSVRNPLERGGRTLLRWTPWGLVERRRERRFYEAPDPAPRVLAISRYMEAEILADYGIPPEHVHIIHNGVDLDEFNPQRRAELRAQERARFGIPDQAVCVLFMGHNFRRKGLWPVMEALGALGTQDADGAPGDGPGRPPVHLLVAGRGTGDRQRKKAEGLARQLGLEGRVHLPGPVRPAIRAFAAADLFAFLSWHDAFGFVALEAMAAGLPVVTTPFAGAHEVMQDGVSGLVVDPGDEEAVVAAFRSLLDPEVRAVVGAQAARMARGYSEEANFARVLEVFRAAAADRSPVL